MYSTHMHETDTDKEHDDTWIAWIAIETSGAEIGQELEYSTALDCSL